MLLFFIAMSIIWLANFFIMLLYVNLHVLKKENDKRNILQKQSLKFKKFITKDENVNGRRIFVVIVGASIITAIIFILLMFMIFAQNQSFIETFIITLLLVSIGYWIGSKFIKGLAYQLFEKNN